MTSALAGRKSLTASERFRRLSTLAGACPKLSDTLRALASANARQTNAGSGTGLRRATFAGLVERQTLAAPTAAAAVLLEASGPAFGRHDVDGEVGAVVLAEGAARTVGEASDDRPAEVV
jgi:hypothetical protein